MQLEKELTRLIPHKETVLTIGVFDSVHLGHQHLIAHLKDQAQKRGALSGVVTFDPHPKTVLTPQSKLPWLTDLEYRTTLLKSMGVDIIIALSFTTDLAQVSAREFVQLLKSHLKMCGLIIGPDFSLCKNREGNADQLRLLGQEMGFSVEVGTPVTLNGEVVSSTAIRQALTRGEVEKVKQLIGRPFRLVGEVVHGSERGRSLGFPTANLDIKPEQALPDDGVYATIAHTDHEPLPSVTNIGTRPTFGVGDRLVEVHLLNHTRQLLGQKLGIDFVHKLRGERRFGNVEELKAQIEKDIEQSKAILKNHVTNK